MQKVYLFKSQTDLIPGEEYLLVAPKLGVHEIIGHKEMLVWKALQQGLPEWQITAQLSIETGQFEVDYVNNLVAKWRQLGLIGEELNSVKKLSLGAVLQKLVWRDIQINQVDEWLNRLRRKLNLRPTAARIAGIISIFIIASGIAAAVNAYTHGWINLFPNLNLGLFALILGIGLVSLFLHELGHAIAMKWAHARILRAGVALYLGLPVFYVDTTTVWAKSRYKRIATSAAGIVVNLLIAGVAAIVANFVAVDVWQKILWEIWIANIFMAGFSLIPFVKLDGYYILMDLVDIPNLSGKAMLELRNFVYDPLHWEFNLHKLRLALFGLASLICSVLLMIYSIWYWGRLVGALASLLLYA